MRIFLYRVKNVVTGLVSLALVAVFALGGWAISACKLRAIEGERVFYLNSASSQGVRKEELSLRDFANITGESVRFSHEGRGAETLANEIADKYGAEILFTESAGGVTSYYCYTDDWENGLELNGVTVNLHVAVSKTECVVGTPIIFDGF